jgi:hypothetical protein
MIIFGIKGGFGNQLFQFATGYYLALVNNTELKLDLAFFKQDKYADAWRLNMLNVEYLEANNLEIKKIRNCTSSKGILFKIITKLGFRSKYNKKSHIHDSFGHKPSEKILKATDNIYIDGWCVKRDYFDSIRDELLKIYTPRYKFSNVANQIQDRILKTNSVSIHIRRGDYIGNPVFNNLELDYYMDAINLLNKKIKNLTFFVFSNDIDWCKGNIHIKNIEFVENITNNSDIEDFFLMSKCKHNIIANSSFSWWAAYLNNNLNKFVIAPRKWYKDEKFQKSYMRNSFNPNEWITI